MIKKCMIGALVLFLLIIPMALSENPYYLEIQVQDSFLEKPLGDVNVTIDGLTKKTNVNGIVGFDKVENGKYQIELKRKDYKELKKRVTIREATELTFDMEKTSPYLEEEGDNSKKPKVSISGLQNNSIIEKNPLAVDFKAKSSADIKYCRLILQEQGLLGYKSGEKIEESSGRLHAELKNGQYRLKVMCENKFGISYSPEYSIRAEGFTEKKEIVAKQKAKPEPKVSLGVTDAYDEFIKQASQAKKTIGSKDKTAANVLGLFNEIDDYIREAKSLKQKRQDLEKLQIAESDYRSKKNKITRDFNKVKRNTPLSLNVLDKKRIIEPVSKEQTREAVEEYFEARSIDEDVEKLVKRSRELQNGIKTTTDLRQVQIKYASGNKKTFTIITKNFEITTNTSKGFFIELVPEAFASNLQDMTIPFNYELIKEPIIKFNMDSKNSISYYVNSKVDMAVMKEAKSVFLLDPLNPENKITGFSLLGTDIKVGGGNAILIFLALIGVLGSTFIVKRADYSKVRQNFWGLFTAKESNTSQYVQLLHKAMHYLNNNMESKAIELYPQIIKGYKELGEKSKQELKPMIVHLGNLVDAQYIAGLMDRACKEMAEGQFDTGNDLCREIEQCFSELSSETALRLKDKYEFYREMLGLKNQRKNEKARQMYERTLNHGINNMVEDNIFGSE